MCCQSTPKFLDLRTGRSQQNENPPRHQVGVPFRNLLSVPHIRAFAARWHRNLIAKFGCRQARVAWSPDVRPTLIERGTRNKTHFVMLQGVTRLGAHPAAGPQHRFSVPLTSIRMSPSNSGIGAGSLSRSCARGASLGSGRYGLNGDRGICVCDAHVYTPLPALCICTHPSLRVLCTSQNVRVRRCLCGCYAG